ncbi:hypothetical protein [Clostridium folliculivorans]|uniref:Uncharacterized protein n=1 Tax=Clostridium folliculivorans TaxID=2886038 RepID=A0A9W5Y4H0_9CLOT|nr:hypothetical protein [Clostridium folliculivorans]GKU26559.1 hypothetical protein CFOLD11_33860 [Clostridium folliculivorans]GKU29009.1 hypothetical protein CFB3_11150 [Clostridium folliculivorans]
MKDFIFAWKSKIMITKPWLMPILLFTLGVLLSFITYIREKQSKRNSSSDYTKKP